MSQFNQLAKMDFSRHILAQIIDKTTSNKVLIVYGARRVGKTHLMKAVEDQFTGKSLFLNAEDLDTVTLLSDRRVAAYRRWVDDVDLLIIDEAQVVPEIGKSLKLLIDSFPKLTILASGSSAFELSNKTGEPLVGRQIRFQLFPIAQMELSKEENYLVTKQQLETRLIYGSYPEVLKNATAEAKTDYLKELVSAYLLKDILMFEQVRYSHKCCNCCN